MSFDIIFLKNIFGLMDDPYFKVCAKRSNFISWIFDKKLTKLINDGLWLIDWMNFNDY